MAQAMARDSSLIATHAFWCDWRLPGKLYCVVFLDRYSPKTFQSCICLQSKIFLGGYNMSMGAMIISFLMA